MTQAFLVTGAAGGMGGAVASKLSETAAVVGLDCLQPTNSVSECLVDFCHVNLRNFTENDAAKTELEKRVRNCLVENGLSLKGIVNVAAVQKLGSIETLPLDIFRETFEVNCLASIALAQIFYEALALNDGVVINIGSIHAKLTKRHFGAYAASKAALASITRSMALDWKGRVRAVCVEPAAIDTPMLRAGFSDDRNIYDALRESHPSGRIGTVQEVAQLVDFLVSNKATFINGQSIGIDGGIAAQLNDPE